MKPLTYLGFTILSVFIQFCVMEFIHETFQRDKHSINLNETAHKKNDLIKKIHHRPHALFYRTDADQNFEINKDSQFAKYRNSSLEDMIISTSTDTLSTTFDVFYDENTSVIDDFFTTESYFTSSEFDNVTEITLLDKSTSTAKPGLKKNVTSKKKCYCNLLYKQCDINCCCDDDCTEEERSLFKNCLENGCAKSDTKSIYSCNNPAYSNDVSSDVFTDLFCIVKVNLPEKRVKSHIKIDETSINSTLKWTNIVKPDVPHKFKRAKYEYGDPVWLIQNKSFSSIYLPTTVANNYCSSTKPMKFLINERIKCNVNLHELYAFSALKTLEGTKLISVTEVSLNHTDLDCSSLHCTNWTVLVCDKISCEVLNNTLHTPKCTESSCSNLALRLEYNFYYSESRITNASLKLHMSKISTSVPLLVQEIAVKWYLGNESIDNIIQLSGNPGYISGLPIIASSATYNYTDNFFNETYFGKNFVFLPHNVNGKCVWSNIKNKTLLFGLNTRSKCRLSVQHISQKNASSSCRGIQINIKESLRLHRTLFISPYGNPIDLSDDKWIPLEVYDQTFLYGEYLVENTKLKCYNLVTRYAIVIAFTDTSEGNRIVKATVETTSSNITFDTADLSMILTVDVRFIDISMPVSEFARAPHLNLHLPANFFSITSLVNASL